MPARNRDAYDGRIALGVGARAIFEGEMAVFGLRQPQLM